MRLSIDHTRALAEVIKGQDRFETPHEIPGLDQAPPAMKVLLEALQWHRGVTLGRFEVGLIVGEEALVHLEASALPSYVDTTYAASVASVPGALNVVFFWGARGTVVIVDEEYPAKIEYDWLANLVRDNPEDPTVITMGQTCSVFEVPRWTLEEAPKPELVVHTPPDADALRAGKHLFFLSRARTSVSVHKGGLRYLNAAGKRKTLNDVDKATPLKRFAGLSAAGDRAWLLSTTGVMWCALPEGKPKGTLEVHGDVLAVLAGDRLLLRRGTELVLGVDDDGVWRELDRASCLAFGALGFVGAILEGRGFVVTNQDFKVRDIWLGTVSDDKLVIKARCEGGVVDHPDMTTPIFDDGERCVLGRDRPRVVTLAQLSS